MYTNKVHAPFYRIILSTLIMRFENQCGQQGKKHCCCDSASRRGKTASQRAKQPVCGHRLFHSFGEQVAKTRQWNRRSASWQNRPAAGTTPGHRVPRLLQQS